MDTIKLTDNWVTFGPSHRKLVKGTWTLNYVLRRLAHESMMFLVMPLPDDWYEIMCRKDRAPTLDDIVFEEQGRGHDNRPTGP